MGNCWLRQRDAIRCCYMRPLWMIQVPLVHKRISMITIGSHGFVFQCKVMKLCSCKPGVRCIMSKNWVRSEITIRGTLKYCATTQELLSVTSDVRKWTLLKELTENRVTPNSSSIVHHEIYIFSILISACLKCPLVSSLLPPTTLVHHSKMLPKP